MKLHLPKVLMCTLMAVFVSPAMGLSTSDIKSDGGLNYLNVGKDKKEIIFIFPAPNPWGEETWTGDLVVGNLVDENGNLLENGKGHADVVGLVEDGKLVQPDGDSSYTNKLNVNGTLTVQGEGKVLLGGAAESFGFYG